MAYIGNSVVGVEHPSTSALNATTGAFTGAVTANAGVVVDNITIDGTEIDLSSGSLTVDVAGDLILDADGGGFLYKDGGTEIGRLFNSSSDFIIKSIVSDKDLKIQGNDGGATINALVFDMSAAGAAAFNAGATFAGASTITTSDNSNNLTLTSTDADANTGPNLVMHRDSGSPADNDAIGELTFNFDNDAAEHTVGTRWRNFIIDASDGTEDAAFDIFSMKQGSLKSIINYDASTLIINDSAANIDFRIEGATNANLLTVDAGDEAVRINTTATAPGAGNTNAGIEFREAGLAFFSSSSGYVNINTNGDGGQVFINNSGNANGIIGSFDSGQNIFIGSGDTGVTFNPNVDGVLPHNPTTNAQRDNAIDLGHPSYRFDDVYATNGTIQTSDENEKQNIAALTSAEITAAKAISKLFKTFKWKDKVTTKGDAARTHTGVIAQEVQAAMSAAGLDVTKYAFWCSNTWWETTTEMAAVEADEDKGIKAIPAHTRTDTYHTESEAPEGATKHTRLGVRYPELLAFVLADIETRLTALENA